LSFGRTRSAACFAGASCVAPAAPTGVGRRGYPCCPAMQRPRSPHHPPPSPSGPVHPAPFLPGPATLRPAPSSSSRSPVEPFRASQPRAPRLRRACSLPPKSRSAPRAEPLAHAPPRQHPRPGPVSSSPLLGERSPRLFLTPRFIFSNDSSGLAPRPERFAPATLFRRATFAFLHRSRDALGRTRASRKQSGPSRDDVRSEKKPRARENIARAPPREPRKPVSSEPALRCQLGDLQGASSVATSRDSREPRAHAASAPKQPPTSAPHDRREKKPRGPILPRFARPKKPRRPVLPHATSPRRQLSEPRSVLERDPAATPRASGARSA